MAMSAIMDLRLKREGVWLGINAVVGVAFFFVSSNYWIEPELKDVPGASGGGAFIFAILVLWVLAPALLCINVPWLALAVWRGLRAGDWASLPVIALTGGVWVCLVGFSASQLGS